MINNDPTMTQILTVIVNRYGIDIFKNPRRFLALLNDMASGDHRRKERRRIKAALESGAVDILLKAINDQASTKLYIQEAIHHLILQTDMEKEIAKNTIMTIIEAFPVSTNETSLKKKKDHDGNEPTYYPKQKLKIYYLWMIVSIIAFIILLIGIFFVETGVKDWLIGISSGVLLLNTILMIAYLFQEYVFYNEMCQTITILLPIVTIMNLCLRLYLGKDIYEFIYLMISAMIGIGALVNAIYSYIEMEEKWVWINIITVFLNMILFFFGPNLYIWQWFIGLGVAFLLAAIVFAMIEIVEVIGIPSYIMLTIFLILFSLGNIYLLFNYQDHYEIMASCFAIVLIIGSLIGIVKCYYEVSTGFQILNIILLIINGVLLFLISNGSYQQIVHQILYYFI